MSNILSSDEVQLTRQEFEEQVKLGQVKSFKRRKVYDGKNLDDIEWVRHELEAIQREAEQNEYFRDMEYDRFISVYLFDGEETEPFYQVIIKKERPA